MSYVKEKELGFLKFFVYLMGFVLMFGVVILTYIVYKRHYIVFGTSSSNESNIHEKECKTGNLELEISDHIENLYHDKNKIYILTKPTHKQEIIIIDHCNQKILGRMSFKLSQPKEKVNY